MNNLETIIGIEIHLELNTKSKMFSSSKNSFNDSPNTNVSEIDLGYPGTLPTVNKRVVESAIKLGKAFAMDVDDQLHFDRKNYFYTDLPKGYQITQQFRPIGKNGFVPIEIDGIKSQVGLERIHIEEDTAKQIHQGEITKIDYNRAGVPLIEIVTLPVMKSADEAAAYVDSVRQVAKAIDISDAKMEEGSLRVDVNISLRPYGQKEFGTKVEIKNINSISNVKKAIEFEIKRQTNMILTNKEILMETRRFDDKNMSTVAMRSKSSSTDYKYFPEPNIPVIQLDKAWMDSITLNELPWERKERYAKMGIKPEFANILSTDVSLAEEFEKLTYTDKDKLSKIFFSEMVSLANSQQRSMKDMKFNYFEIDKTLTLSDKGGISGKHIKKIIPLLSNSTKDVASIIKENNMKQISDETTLNEIIIKIINNNQALVAEYSTRPERVSKFVLGSLMKETRGQANPIIANQLVQKYLEKNHG